MRALFLTTLALAVGTVAISPAVANPAAKPVVTPADYATQVAGQWHGDVISDARGSSRTGVTITITRIGPNRIQVACDYGRIPTVQMTLGRYADSLQPVSGPYTFLIDLKRDPNRLDLIIDDASLSVAR